MSIDLAQLLNRLANAVLLLPRPVKRVLAFTSDAGLCVLSVWLAFYLRLGVFVSVKGPVMFASVVSLFFALPIFVSSGLYRAIFRYSGLPTMAAVGRALLLYGVVYAGIFTVWVIDGVPRTIGILQPILLFLLVATSRAAAREWLGGLYQRQLRQSSLPQALIYGAGSAGRQFALVMANSPELRVVGFLDDDERLHGQLLNGLPIHNPNCLTEIIQLLKMFLLVLLIQDM